MTDELIFDKDFQKAHDLLLFSNENIFLTGKAGTGKSSLLTCLVKKWTENFILLAPTGVAALNIGGETIHSFFGFKPTITVDEAKKLASQTREKRKKIFKNIELIIIDEISMVRADLLDCVDVFLQTIFGFLKPFGGVRMIFIGDLYQLPPVVTREEKEVFHQMYPTPYFFSANVMENSDFELKFVELETVYRQEDQDFVELLNAIRKNTISDQQLFRLNKRVLIEEDCFDDEGFLYLTATNLVSQKINEKKLSLLENPLKEFQAEVTGDFDIKAAPTETALRLKKEAQVMLLNNHPQNDWVNGSVGKVVSIEDEVEVRLTDGKIVFVKPITWTLHRYIFDDKMKKIKPEEIGSFRQYPMKLAWAITIHKSQGKTFERVIVDLERGAFAHGQVYVALSRCKTFEHLILRKPIQKHQIIMDQEVVKFLTQFQYKESNQSFSKEKKIEIIQRAIEKEKSLKIIYLKTSDEKSTRTIFPTYYGLMQYEGKQFVGLKAFCLKRKEMRIFRIERILEVFPENF